MRLFHVPPGSDAVVEVDAAEFEELRGDGGWLWLDVVGGDGVTVEKICAAFGFDHLAIEDVLAESAYPKADDYPDHTLVILHGVADDPTAFRTVEYDSFIGPDYLVVFRAAELAGFDWVREQLLETGHRAPEGPDRLFGLLADAGATRFQVLVDALEQKVEELEEQALGGDPEVIGEVHALRRDAVKLRRVLGPQRDTVHRLASDEFPALGIRARMRLRSAHDQFDQATQSLDSSRSLLGAVLETYRAVVAERANEVMKVLAVFAAILLPLSVIAGVYGMNFANMPELDWRWAYFGVLGLMGTVAVTLWLYFARRGFIGGPRLGRIPKALSHGLAGLVALTTRPVSKVGRMLTGRDRRS